MRKKGINFDYPLGSGMTVRKNGGQSEKWRTEMTCVGVGMGVWVRVVSTCSVSRMGDNLNNE